jgi:precorrin-2 dehydrogenase / sirohydrochlorin ferrochelatase
VPHLPLNINVRGMIVLVVGGGSVAGRKIVSLLEAGAAVRVVAPDLAPEIIRLAAAGSVDLKTGCYEPLDLRGIFLVVAATNDLQTNRRIALDARKRGILVAVANEPKSGNCSFPAVLRRGNLEVGVSTNGTCPGFAAAVRDIIARLIGNEYGEILEVLAAEREKLLTEGKGNTYNKQILDSRARQLLAELSTRKDIP